MKKNFFTCALLFIYLAASAQLTLEKLLAVPFPSALTAAPSGNGLAWVQNEQGKRNIYLATAPTFQFRKLTDFKEDDGQELSSIGFSSDARTIVFVRGGNPNRKGEPPNPAQFPGSTEQAIYKLSPDGVLFRICDGSHPLVSPTASQLVFSKNGYLYLAQLAGSEPPKLIVKLRGNAGSVAWSPDGTKIVFASDRNTHSFIGVYDVVNNTVRFMEPGIDEDIEPVWSPDSRLVAFVRKPAPANPILSFTAIRQAPPWSLWVADAATGKATSIFQADPGTGSAFWNNDGNLSLLWTADNSIVFPWEKDGWLHLYAVPATGGKPLLLTPGNFEVDEVTLSPDRKSLVFSSNQNDPSHRHLWKTGTSGGNPVALTSGTGIETTPVWLSDSQTLVLLHSDASHPLAPAYLSGSNAIKNILTSSPDFPSSELTQPENIMLSATDGMSVPCQLFLPKKSAVTRHPAVIFIHGGSRRQMLSGFHPMGYYHNAYAFNQWLASRGFVVLAVNYRSGIGYGMPFREAINYGAGGCSEFQDILGAGLYLKNRPEVDSKKIALWGGSYGGYLTAMALAKASDLFACGVDLHGVHNWKNDMAVYMPGYDPIKFEEASALAFRSSPVAYLQTWRSPVLLIHGDDDHDVLFSETIELERALREQKVPVEHLILPDEAHGFLMHRSWLKVYHTMTDYLEKQLK